MRKMSALALVALALWGSNARAIDIKNVRSTYGPFGALRPGNKMLPGDVFVINFDVSGVSVDAKNGLTKYTQTLEVFDPKGKSIFKETSNKALYLGLGGDTVPELANVLLGADLGVGKYQAKVTITDPAKKDSKTLVQDLEVIQPDFGFIHVMAPAMGFKGQDYYLQYALVGFGRDKKNYPNINLSMRVLADGKPTFPDPIASNIPRDYPKIQADKAELLRLGGQIYLNRTGRFTVEVEAIDEISKKKDKFSFPLTVIDPTGK
jgi:hypothetical protein